MRRAMWWIIGGVVLLVVGFFTMGIVSELRYENIPDTHDLPVKVEAAAKELVGNRSHARLTIGIYQKGERWVKSFGSFAPANAATPDGEVIYEIGSITKVFTGITLARLVNEKQVQLSDTLSQFVPDVSDELKPLTLLQLATHSSGLPRLPVNLDATIKNEQDPYAQFTAADLLAGLKTTTLDVKPGHESSYSNLGMGLLGHLCAEKAKKPYAELVEETITRPLKMNDTTMSPSDAQQKRLVGGHDSDGKACHGWTFQVLAPTGGLRSTANDMLNLLEGHLKGTSEPLQAHLQLALKEHYSSWSGKLGLAWHIAPVHNKLTVHWHNGGTGGYSSFMALSKDHQTGVILLLNTSEAESGKLDELGMQVIKWASKISLK